MAMTQQGEMFGRGAYGQPVPRAKQLARTTDPETSHDAARAILPALGTMQAETLAAVRRWPDRTVTELAQLTEHGDPRVINRRVSELAADGRIVASGERTCSVTGRRARTWWAAT